MADKNLDFTHLSEDEKINGIKITTVPQYIREKAYLTDFSETLAQLAEMIIQLGVNLSLDPDEALEWARKLQQSISQSEFDSWVATLLDGGPSIFMNTLIELQTTYPNGAPGVALVRETDPAKIYVWNGSAWESFGNYQGIIVKDGSITTDKLADKAMTPEKTNFVETGRNKFNKNNVERGRVLYPDREYSEAYSNERYYISHKIYVKSGDIISIRKVTSLNTVEILQVFDIDGKHLQTWQYRHVGFTFEMPALADHIRYSGELKYIDQIQIEFGAESTPYESYKLVIPDLETTKAVVSTDSKLYSFLDAQTSWLDGEKFPIAVYGDSTDEGVVTSTHPGANVIGTDYINTTSWPSVLQKKLREWSGNSLLRVYNAGFSGQDAAFGAMNVSSIFGNGGIYADAKMILIKFGINDRMLFNDETKLLTQRENIDWYTKNMADIIEWCLENDKQPVLVTSQSIIAPRSKFDYAKMTDSKQNDRVNDAKRELAEIYNIPLIEMSDNTEQFFIYSSYSADELLPDYIHGGDIMNAFKADVAFNRITEFPIEVERGSKVGFFNQNIKSDIVTTDNLTKVTISSDFKVIANYTKADENAEIILEAYVYNGGKEKLSLYAHKSLTNSMTYVKVNGGPDVSISELNTKIADLEIGLHKLVVGTGLSNLVDFKGFTFE